MEIESHQYSEAWDRLFSDWLPGSGYQSEYRMCFEIHLNDPEEHPKGLHLVDICEPIRAL